MLQFLSTGLKFMRVGTLSWCTAPKPWNVDLYLGALRVKREFPEPVAGGVPPKLFGQAGIGGRGNGPGFLTYFPLGPGQSGPYPTGQPGPSGRRLHFPPPLRLALTPNQLLNHGRPQGRLSGETLGSHVTAGGLSGSDSARGLRGRCPVQESG